MLSLALVSSLLHPVAWFFAVLAVIVVSLFGFSTSALPALIMAFSPLLALTLLFSWLTGLSEVYSGISKSIMLIGLTAGLYLCLSSDAYLNSVFVFSVNQQFSSAQMILLALSHSVYLAAGVVVLMIGLAVLLEFSLRFVFGDSICGLQSSFESLRAALIAVMLLCSFSAVLDFFVYAAK